MKRPKKIIELFKNGEEVETIVKITEVNKRCAQTRIREYRKGQTNKWSDEEVSILIENYNKGIVKASALTKILTNKSDWMIRNRILLLQRKNKLPKAKPKIKEEQSCSKEIEIEEPPIVVLGDSEIDIPQVTEEEISVPMTNDMSSFLFDLFDSFDSYDEFITNDDFKTTILYDEYEIDEFF